MYNCTLYFMYARVYKSHFYWLKLLMDKHFDRILQLESPNSIGRNDHLYSK